MASIQDVVDAVAAESTVDDSVLAFLAGLQQQLADALAKVGVLTPEQQAAVDGVFATANANVQKMSTAIATPPARKR